MFLDIQPKYLKYYLLLENTILKLLRMLLKLLVAYKGKHVGTFGDIGILSFNGNKIVTTGVMEQ